MPRIARTPAYGRYQQRVVLASLLYAAALFATTWVFRHEAPHGAAAYALAAAPALPLLGVFVALGVYLREEVDEYQRLLMVRQILVATGGALAVATVYGFVESFAPAHHFAAYWLAVVWFFFFGVGRLVRERL